MNSGGWKTKDKFVSDKGEENNNYRDEADKEQEKRKEEIGLYKRKIDSIIFLPDSLLINEPSLREKTYKYLQIIRSLSIFRVNKLVIYRDPLLNIEPRYDKELIMKLHNYYLIPPYLRKKLIPIDPMLKYVGAAPPLRLLIHSVGSKPVIGEYRQGYVEKKHSSYVLVDAGLKKLVRVKCIDGCPSREKVILFKLTSTRPLEGEYRKLYHSILYTGPILEYIDDLFRGIKKLRDNEYYLMATSKYGKKVCLNLLSSLRKSFRELYRGIVVLFGAPYYGLYEIFRGYGKSLEEYVDIVINILPNQGTKTVRMEEALHSTLSIINLII